MKYGNEPSEEKKIKKSIRIHGKKTPIKAADKNVKEEGKAPQSKYKLGPKVKPMPSVESPSEEASEAPSTPGIGKSTKLPVAHKAPEGKKKVPIKVKKTKKDE